MDADQRHAQAKHEQRQTARGHAPTRWSEKRATVHRDLAEGKEMSVRGSNWTAEEDRRLLDLSRSVDRGYLLRQLCVPKTPPSRSYAHNRPNWGSVCCGDLLHSTARRPEEPEQVGSSVAACGSK
jgi:hypothetical protein